MIGNLLLHFIWNVIIAAGFISCVAMAARIWFHFPDRTKDDVVDFLVHIDLEKAETLLDPIAENSLRRTLSPAEFRILQRKRIHLYIEFLQRMSHNAAILVQWGNLEAQRSHERTAQLAHELQQEAVKVRAYSLLALMKLRFWLLIRLGSWYMLPTPSLSELRGIYGIEGLDAYDRLKTVASSLFVGHEKFEELLQNL